MDSTTRNPRSSASIRRDTPDTPGAGDDVPCVACGEVALDTGLECTECGHDNWLAVYGKPFDAALAAKGE